MARIKSKLTPKEKQLRKRISNMKYRKSNNEKSLELKRKYRKSNPEYVHRDNLKRKERKRIQKRKFRSPIKVESLP
jgi:hypothetical protein